MTSHCKMRQGNLLPQIYTRHPFDATAWLATSLVGTRPPGTHLYSWVDWSKVSKVSCSRKQRQHQSRNWIHNLLIHRPMPWPPGYAGSHLPSLLMPPTEVQQLGPKYGLVTMCSLLKATMSWQISMTTKLTTTVTSKRGHLQSAQSHTGYAQVHKHSWTK